MSRAVRRGIGAGLLAGCMAFGVGLGCQSSRVSASDGARPEDQRERTPEERLGYRLAWIGYPNMTSRQGAKFFDVLGDAVVVQDYNNIVTVMDAGSGRNRWGIGAGDSLKNFVGNARAGDHLIVSSDTEAQLYDIMSGELVDRQRLGALASTRPVVVGGIAVYGCRTGEVMGHHLGVGLKAWGFDLKGAVETNPVRVGDYDVAAVSDAGEVVILDARDGASKGRFKRVFDGLNADPVGDDRGVYFGSRDQSIWAFSGSTGEQMWRIRTESPITEQPALHDNRLYVHLEREGLVALDALTGQRLWANDTAKGDVLGIRDGRLMTWDGEAFTFVDAANGETLDRIVLPHTKTIALGSFEDGALYAISRLGEVRKYIPSY